jgi:hypothetical protein
LMSFSLAQYKMEDSIDHRNDWCNGEIEQSTYKLQ